MLSNAVPDQRPCDWLPCARQADAWCLRQVTSAALSGAGAGNIGERYSTTTFCGLTGSRRCSRPACTPEPLRSVEPDSRACSCVFRRTHTRRRGSSVAVTIAADELAIRRPRHRRAQTGKPSAQPAETTASKRGRRTAAPGRARARRKLSHRGSQRSAPPVDELMPTTQPLDRLGRAAMLPISAAKARAAELIAARCGNSTLAHRTAAHPSPSIGRPANRVNTRQLLGMRRAQCRQRRRSNW